MPEPSQITIETRRREFDLLRECTTSPEHREAIAAFTEKRAPKFR